MPHGTWLFIPAAFAGRSGFFQAPIELMVGALYLHPSGQMPAYEWNFGDVNPPVHAWAAIFLHNLQKSEDGKGDREFLKRIFHKLVINFTWWVNRKDRFGKNVFEGGFLGTGQHWRSLTGARVSRAEVTLSKRMGRHGWPSIAKICARSH